VEGPATHFTRELWPAGHRQGGGGGALDASLRWEEKGRRRKKKGRGREALDLFYLVKLFL
jgi:hypothetical protein